MRSSAILFLLAVAAILVPVRAIPQDKEEKFPEAEEALWNCAVMIQLYMEQNMGASEGVACGTGVLLAGGTRVATNLHVAGRDESRLMESKMNAEYGVRGSLKIQVTDYAGVREKSLIQYDSKWQDVTILNVGPGRAKGINAYVGTSDLAPGDLVFTMGNQLCQSWTASAGSILDVVDKRTRDGREFLSGLRDQLRSMEGGADLSSESYERLIITTPFINHGNSGGPVVDRHGRLVGIAYAGSGAYGVIIPMEYLFKALGQSAPGTTALAGTGANVTQNSLSSVAGPADDPDAIEVGEPVSCEVVSRYAALPAATDQKLARRIGGQFTEAGRVHGAFRFEQAKLKPAAVVEAFFSVNGISFGEFDVLAISRAANHETLEIPANTGILMPLSYPPDSFLLSLPLTGQELGTSLTITMRLKNGQRLVLKGEREE